MATDAALLEVVMAIPKTCRVGRAKEPRAWATLSSVEGATAVAAAGGAWRDLDRDGTDEFVASFRVSALRSAGLLHARDALLRFVVLACNGMAFEGEDHAQTLEECGWRLDIAEVG